jgi:hypothetical protein
MLALNVVHAQMFARLRLFIPLNNNITRKRIRLFPLSETALFFFIILKSLSYKKKSPSYRIER